VKAPRVALGASICVGALYFALLRRPTLTWGATEAEAASRLPGDELLEEPDGMSTRAIGIDAPASAVWPWIVQMGPSPRAGAYTYDWIENLLGLNMHSADRILPEFQQPMSARRSGTDRTECGSKGSSPTACSPGAPKMETGSGRSCCASMTTGPG
jgi:hypothetical protein